MSPTAREFTEKSALLDNKGKLIESGWSRSMLLDYRRNDVPFFRRYTRLRESERFIISSDDHQLILSISDNGYYGMISATVASLLKESEKTTDIIIPVPFGRFELPQSSEEGEVIYRSKRLSLDFTRSPGERHIRCQFNYFDDVRPLYVNLTVPQNGFGSLCTAQPYKEDSNGFIYCCRTLGMRASGKVVYGGESMDFLPEDTFVCHEWIRTVMPREARRVWCEGFGTSNGEDIGFSFGDGSGDASYVGENVIFFSGEVHKVGKLKIEKDDSDCMKPWIIRSGDRDVYLEFRPVSGDSNTRNFIGLVKGEKDYAFGRYYGSVKVGRRQIDIDGIVGFVEDYYIKG